MHSPLNSGNHKFFLYMAGIVMAAILIGFAIVVVRDNKAVPVPGSGPGPIPASKPHVQGSGPHISDQSRMELLTAFEHGIMYSQDQSRRQKELCDADQECKQAGENTQKAIQEWNALVKAVIAREKLSPDAGFNVDPSTGTVNVVIPGQK